jgi:aspartyl-tRNA(Asn)/glutamyl-tRNA(Gln) amidotransferase subunit B
VDGHVLRCGIVRVHLEEDTGKSIHTSVDDQEVSLIDYNRSGVPLIEIVSEPDIRTPEQASAYFAALRRILMYLGICDGRLQDAVCGPMLTSRFADATDATVRKWRLRT